LIPLGWADTTGGWATATGFSENGNPELEYMSVRLTKGGAARLTSTIQSYNMMPEVGHDSSTNEAGHHPNPYFLSALPAGTGRAYTGSNRILANGGSIG
jgi:hypothetical protein